MTCVLLARSRNAGSEIERHFKKVDNTLAYGVEVIIRQSAAESVFLAVIANDVANGLTGCCSENVHTQSFEL